jgi:hypothetical protein
MQTPGRQSLHSALAEHTNQGTPTSPITITHHPSLIIKLATLPFS